MFKFAPVLKLHNVSKYWNLCRHQIIITTENEGYWCYTLEKNITSNIKILPGTMLFKLTKVLKKNVGMQVIINDVYNVPFFDKKYF